MFYGASAFNQDLSEWKVGRVTNMASMFRGATSFKQVLCGEAWVKSRARKVDMFRGSLGSIAKKKCYSPENTDDLIAAVKACLTR